MTDPKKEAAQTRKPPIVSMIPPVARKWHSVAHLEGALKYGAYNWRDTDIDVSIYLDAMGRHIDKLAGGQFTDPATGIPHLASVMASAAILLDSFERCGWNWDLPDPDPADEYPPEILSDEVMAVVMKQLYELHGSKTDDKT